MVGLGIIVVCFRKDGHKTRGMEGECEECGRREVTAVIEGHGQQLGSLPCN